MKATRVLIRLALGVSVIVVASCTAAKGGKVTCDTTRLAHLNQTEDSVACIWEYALDGADSCTLTSLQVQATGASPDLASIGVIRSESSADASTSMRSPTPSGSGWILNENGLNCSTPLGCPDGKYLVTVAKGSLTCADFGTLTLELRLQ